MLKIISLIAIAAGLLLIAVGIAGGRSGKSDFDAAQELIVMRNIAHRVLIYTGDSTSPVAAVERISANEFQIRFARNFFFLPDSLVRIIDRAVSEGRLSPKYIVNVMEQQTNRVVYGYAMLGEQKSIVPCVGRAQPELPYYIDIRFQQEERYPAKGLCLGGIGMLIMGLLVLGSNRYMSKRKDLTNADRGSTIDEVQEPQAVRSEKARITIGKYIFFPVERILLWNDVEMTLTAKESKILEIFAAAPNQLIDRQRLQKEIWEDEGVIVGRSLDMFISRLRKKLENDPDIRLTNIHSKGYKLEVVEEKEG